ncbi:MAG TPA: hypothetical protein VH813_02265 [Candidatus Limnocylindrales bacterium]|jgi:hypothetical protein
MIIAQRSFGLSVLLLSTVVVSACSGAAAPGGSSPPPSSGPPASSPSSPPPSADPSLPADTPIVGEPPPGGGQPGGAGQPSFVIPRPGAKDPHPVAITQLSAQVTGRQVVLNARWMSGVEPCYVLDSVRVEREGNTFTITVIEGSGDSDAMCIEIAVEKVTAINLGELASGTYIVQPGVGDAASITVVVP